MGYNGGCEMLTDRGTGPDLVTPLPPVGAHLNVGDQILQAPTAASDSLWMSGAAQGFSRLQHCHDSAYVHPASPYITGQLGHVCAIPSKKPNASSVLSRYACVPKGSSK